MADEQARQLLDQARENLKYSQYHSAAGQARQVLEQAPNDVEARAILGIALSRLNQPQEATQALEAALRLAPNDARNYYNLAAHFYSIGRKADALGMAREALRNDASHTAAQELVRRLEQEQMHQPPSGFEQPIQPSRGPYTYGAPRPEYRPAKPRIEAIRSMGAGWDIVGWVLGGVFLAVQIYTTILVLGMVDFAQTQDFAEIFNQIAERMAQYPVLQLSSLASSFLWAVWWIIDMVDKRPSAGLIVLGALAVLGMCCCGCLPIIGFPIYMLMRNR